MSSLRHLLQEADPLLHEPRHFDAHQERLWLAIRRAIASDRPRQPLVARLRLVVVAAMCLVAVVVAGYATWTRGVTPAAAAVRFEMRLAEDEPAPGLIVARTIGASKMIYLHPEVVVTNDDLANSWVVEDPPNHFGISIELLPSGAGRLRQATAEHVGHPVAILIDGKVVMAPIVRAPVSDAAVITGEFTRAEAERIAEGIRLQ